MWRNFRKPQWHYLNLEKKKTIVPISRLQVNAKRNLVNKIPHFHRTVELKQFKDQSCYDYWGYHPLEPNHWEKKKIERQSEQTITLLEIYSATIITKKKKGQLKVTVTHKAQTRSLQQGYGARTTSCSRHTAAARDGKQSTVNQTVLVLLDFSHFPSLYLQQKSQKCYFLFTFAFLQCNLLLRWILNASIKFKLSVVDVQIKMDEKEKAIND